LECIDRAHNAIDSIADDGNRRSIWCSQVASRRITPTYGKVIFLLHTVLHKKAENRLFCISSGHDLNAG
jgi:hypothetical protein